MKRKSLFVFMLLLSYLANSQPKQISISVDERVELITTMQLLFGYPLVSKADIAYTKQVRERFLQNENDTSVKYFLKIAQNNFGFGKPFSVVFHYTFPGIKQKFSFSEFEETQYEFGAHPEWKKPFISALKKFYTKTKFHNFFTEQKHFYNSLVNTVKPIIDSLPLVETLETHYGIKQHSYSLILSPLSIEAGYSIWIKTKKGNDLYSIIGPNLDSKGIPDFDTRWLVQYLVLHEFSHPFCNPVIDKYREILEKDSCLFNPISKAMDQQGCDNWIDALHEHLTRANEIVLIEKVFGKEDADKVYNDYLKQKWIYLKGLVPLIKKMQADRFKYKTLEDIMPEVTDYFRMEAKQCP